MRLRALFKRHDPADLESAARSWQRVWEDAERIRRERPRPTTDRSLT